MKETKEAKRIETKLEVETYLARLKYAIQDGAARVEFIEKRRADKGRDKKYTNRYTMGVLFPDEDFVEALKRELAKLTVKDYIETVKDINRPKHSEFRVFGKQYFKKDVYIKIRVELTSTLQANGGNYVLVMSFHFSELDFENETFPYNKL